MTDDSALSEFESRLPLCDLPGVTGVMLSTEAARHAFQAIRDRAALVEAWNDDVAPERLHSRTAKTMAVAVRHIRGDDR